MGLYLLNLSVDTQDSTPRYQPEDLSINDQESIIEILVEQILGFENAVAEYDDSDTEEHSKQANIKIVLFTTFIDDSTGPLPLIDAVLPKFPDHNTYLTSGFQQLDTPPPRI